MSGGDARAGDREDDEDGNYGRKGVLEGWPQIAAVEGRDREEAAKHVFGRAQNHMVESRTQ